MFSLQLAEVYAQAEVPCWGHDISMSSAIDIAFEKHVSCIKPAQLYFKETLFSLS